MTTYEQFLQDGFHFEVSKRITTRFSKTKTRQFHIEPPTLAVLAKLSSLYEKLELPEEIENIHAETARRSFISCRIVAVAYLSHLSQIPGLSRLFALYFYYHIDAEKLDKLQQMIHGLSNFPAFLNSIRLLGIPKSVRDGSWKNK